MSFDSNIASNKTLPFVPDFLLPFIKFYNTCGPLVIHELFIRIFAYSWPNIPVFFLKNPLNKNNHYSKHSRFCYSQNWYLVNACITSMKFFTIIQTQKKPFSPRAFTISGKTQNIQNLLFFKKKSHKDT